VIDVDIKAFFGQISYQWILNNFPIPSGTKRILEKWFKSPIEYQGELEVFLFIDKFSCGNNMTKCQKHY
jgi:hypothetical protein